MYFKEIIDEFNCGKKIRRASWPIGIMIDRNNERGVNIKDLLGDDWQVIDKRTWWEPKPGDAYWCLEYNGVPWKCTDEDQWSEGAIAIGNYFTTCDESEFMTKKLKVIHELTKFAYQQDDAKIDWYDECQEKWFFVYNIYKKNLEVFFSNDLVILPFQIFFASEELAKEAIEAIGEERILKYYFGVNEDE